MSDLQLPDDIQFLKVATKTLAAHHGTGLIWADLHLNSLYASEEAYSLLGISPDAAIVRLTKMVPELVGLENSLLEVAYQKCEPVEVEFINRETPKGEAYFINITAYPALAPDGSPGILLLIEDTTSLGGLIHELAQKKNEMRLLKDSTGNVSGSSD